MGWLIRGKIPAEQANPINRWLTHIYRPAIDWTLHRPKTVLLIAALVFATTAFPLSRLGGEFMPNMDEGDLLYMPRSEEHTSELQSLMRISYAVFCLQKKNNNTNNNNQKNTNK